MEFLARDQLDAFDLGGCWAGDQWAGGVAWKHFRLLSGAPPSRMLSIKTVTRRTDITDPPLAMYRSMIALLLLPLLIVNLARSCSVPGGVHFPYYTPGQRAVLAPVLFEGIVQNTTAPQEGPARYPYKACVLVKRKLKEEIPVPDELCFGEFGPEELCLQNVFAGVRYVFFLGTDLKALYYVPQLVSAFFADEDTIAAVEEGIPCGNSSGRDDCGRTEALYVVTSWPPYLLCEQWAIVDQSSFWGCTYPPLG